MIARVAPVLTLLACAALGWTWGALDSPVGTIFAPLRGTMIWDLRWIALGCAFIALLGIVERVATWVAAIGKKRDPH